MVVLLDFPNFFQGANNFIIVKAEIGPVTDGDLYDAWTHDAELITMDVPQKKKNESKAKEYDVKVKNYNIIYKLMEDLQALNEEFNAKVEKTRVVGKGEILKLFEIKLNSKRKISNLPKSD